MLSSSHPIALVRESKKGPKIVCEKIEHLSESLENIIDAMPELEEEILSDSDATPLVQPNLLKDIKLTFEDEATE